MTIVTTEELVSKRPYFISGAKVSVTEKPSSALTEDYLARKANRSAELRKELSYDITSDSALLHQYYRLREEMFISVWGLEHFSGAEDSFDKHSSFIIARQGHQCVGGARITVSNTAHRSALPMEKNDFVLKDLLPELSLDSCAYGEISRLAILPDFRKGQILPEMLRRAIRWGIAEGLQYAFTLSPVALARNYRQLGQVFGIDWKISDIAIPQREEYEGIKMVLSYGHLLSGKPHLAADEVVAVNQSSVMAE